MAAAIKQKVVSFALTRGIRMHGKSIFAYQTKKVGTGANAKEEKVQTVIAVRESLARELTLASKGAITDKKPNVTISEPTEADELAEAFGEGGDKE